MSILGKLSAEYRILDEQRDKLFAERDKLNKKITALGKKIDEINIAIFEESVKETSTQSEKIELLLNNARRKTDRVRQMTEEFFQELGFEVVGHWNTTDQHTLHLKLIKGDEISYNTVVKGIKEVLPFIKKVDGKKRFAIFEHTFSEWGCYELHFSKDDTVIELIKLSHGKTNVVQSFRTIENAVDYIQEHHWYTGGESAYEDDYI